MLNGPDALSMVMLDVIGPEGTMLVYTSSDSVHETCWTRPNDRIAEAATELTMIERARVVGWLALSSLAGGVLTGGAVLIATGAGYIRAEPALGFLTFVCGLTVWAGATWRVARQWRHPG